MQSERIVVGQDGWQGTLLQEGADYAVIQLEDGQSLHVPLTLLHRDAEQRYRLDLSRADLAQFIGPRRAATAAAESASTVIPVIEETLSVEKREVEAGGVRIHKRVEEREEVVELPLMREEVAIERVPVNRYLDGGAVPEMRSEGDTTIIPLIEEVLVVEKRLLLREELHVTRRRSETMSRQTVTLRREDVTVEEIGPDGSTAARRP